MHNEEYNMSEKYNKIIKHIKLFYEIRENKNCNYYKLRKISSVINKLQKEFLFEYGFEV